MGLKSILADRVDGDRLWRSILDMAKIGATANGGSSRVAFSREDDEGRMLFKTWCEQAGLTVTNDVFGNMYALRNGRSELEPLMIGSHLDTQPKGGRFDGVLGVLGGLEVIRALNDAGAETERPIVLVNWTNEEGAVLTPMMGSAVYTGSLDLNRALESSLPNGSTVKEALSVMRCGAGDAPTGFPIHAYLELHIEQGPVLENEKLTIGVVTGGIGFKRYLVRFEGEEAHAGPTPMPSRKDPVVAAARTVVFADDLARRVPDARSTVGTIKARGGSPNTVAAAMEFTLDIRHPDAATIAQIESELAAATEEIAARGRVMVSFDTIADSPPAPFDSRIVSAVEDAALTLGYAHRSMPSGAGHDACNISRNYPTGMIFVPSVGGLSHNEAELTAPADCTAGVKVLAQTVVQLVS